MKDVSKMIRTYQPKDINTVVAIWRAASQRAHPFLTAAFLEQEAENLRTIYVVHADTRVIEHDGSVVGFIALINTEIGGLFVAPDFHGQGFGRALVDKALAEKGILSVEVFKKNVIGRRFYHAYGFRGDTEYLHAASGQLTLQLAYPAKG